MLVSLIWKVPPGVCVALVGLEALVLTFFEVRGLQRRVAIVFAVLFTACEIAVIAHDRNEALEQHKRDMELIVSRIAAVDEDVLAIQNNYRAQRAIPVAADSLRNRTLDLANEILQFLLGREVPPGYGQGGFGEGPYGGKPSDAKIYDQETLNMYRSVFEPRVSKIRDELKQRGLTDSELDREYNQTANTYSIRAIAKGLTALAERLPR
jgi:hypothetical protein